MPYNGSGTFSRLYSWVVDAANSVNISSTRTDAEMNGFAAGLTNCITRDGQSPPSADIPMGGKKLVNLGLATVGTDALSQAAGDARYLTAAGGVANALTINSGGAGVASGGTFNGSAAITISYNSIGAAPLASPAFTGTPTAPSPAGADNSQKLATTGWVNAAISTYNSSVVGFYAPLGSPALTGTPTAPTAGGGTNSTQVATTAFVTAAIGAISRAPVGQTITSSATVTPTFSDDFVEITAQAAGLTLANPTGSAVNMWGTAVRIKDNGSPQTIAFGTQYRGVGVTLPTTTVATKTLVLGMIFNNALTKWDVVSVAQE